MLFLQKKNFYKSEVLDFLEGLWRAFVSRNTLYDLQPIEDFFEEFLTIENLVKTYCYLLKTFSRLSVVSGFLENHVKVFGL